MALPVKWAAVLRVVLAHTRTRQAHQSAADVLQARFLQAKAHKRASAALQARTPRLTAPAARRCVPIALPALTRTSLACQLAAVALQVLIQQTKLQTAHKRASAALQAHTLMRQAPHPASAALTSAANLCL